MQKRLHVNRVKSVIINRILTICSLEKLVKNRRSNHKKVGSSSCYRVLWDKSNFNFFRTLKKEKSKVCLTKFLERTVGGHRNLELT